jgi:hypothetical protein
MPDTNTRVCTARDGDILRTMNAIRKKHDVGSVYFVEMMNDVRHFLLMTFECGNHLFTVFVEDNCLSIIAT